MSDEHEEERTQEYSRAFAWTTRRPVAIAMVVAAVAVFGWVSYERLPLNLMPDISYPTLTVRTEYPGTAPEEVENLISRPAEQALGVVGNLVGVSSVSRAGLSDVILEFGWNTNMDQAIQTVRENLDRVGLPEGVQKPLILRYDPTLDPIMRIGLYGSDDMFAMRRVAEEEIKRTLESLSGVAAARVRGGLEEEIWVELKETQLASVGLSISDVNRRLQEENVNLAGGNLIEGQTQYLVRTLNEFRGIEEMSDLVVGHKNGVDIKLRDVGRVVKTHKEREILTRVNGRESVEIDIFKEADANIVAVAQKVRDRLSGTKEQQEYVAKLQAGTLDAQKDGKDLTADQLRQAQAKRAMERRQMTDFLAYSLPEGMQVDLLSDQSKFVQSAIDEVKDSAIIGGILALLIIYIFLENIWHTLIVGVSLPLSVVAAFAPMNLFGVSLNIMSLGGLALGIGMLVDDSIVVLESIFRCREQGDDMVTAAVRGTGEVGGAVLSSTLTTVAVFFPMVFVEGIAGQVFGDMALVVVFSVMASLAAALYLVPMLASRTIQYGEGSAGGALLQADIRKVRAVGRIRAEMAAPRQGVWGAARVYRRCLKVFPSLVFELLWRTLLIVASIACAVLKLVSILVWGTLWPVLKGVEKIVRKRQASADDADDADGRRRETLFQKLVRWSLERQVFGWAGPGRVWDSLMAFRAAEDMGTGLPEGLRWAMSGLEGRRVWRILQVVLFLLFPLSALLGLIFWPDAVAWLKTWAPAMLQGIIGGPEENLGWKILQGFRVAFLALFLSALLWIAFWFVLSGALFVASLMRRGLRQRARQVVHRGLVGLRAASLPVLLIYFYIRFVVHLAIALIGKILIAAVTLAGVVLVCAAWIGGLVVAPFLSLLVFTVGGFFNWVNDIYPHVIRWALSNRMTVVWSSTAMLGVAVLVLAPRLGQELMPEVHQGEFNVEVSLPVGAPIEVTDRQARGIEQAVMEQPGVARVSTVVGTEREATSSSDEGENTAKITSVLKTKEDLASVEDAAISSLRERLSGIPQVTIKFSRPALFSFKTPIEVEIRGYDLTTLQHVAKEAEEAMARVPGLTDVKSNLQRGSPEVQISYDRDRLARYDLNLMQVATIVRNKVQGQVATRFRDKERRVDVVVRLDEADRQSVRNIENMTINPNGKVQIPLSAVADVRISDGPSEIRRIDQERAALLTANLTGVDIGTASDRIHEALSRVDMPKDFEFIVAGQNKEMETSLRSLKLALILSMFLVYIVMAMQFESFLHPFVIMFTIPLAVVGVVFALYALSIPISVMVFLGVIILAGVVVKNAIVLLDYTNLLRARGMSKIEALVLAGHTRLRPIIMTTLTTVLGLVPMALGLGEGAELRMPLAITVIAGLTSSTILTLVVIPVVYASLDRKE